jgi:isoleucyl-tRNA synthetase
LREVASTALRIREDAGLRVRLPLAGVTVAGQGALDLDGLVELLADEINVRTVTLTEDISEHAAFVLRPNGGVLGPRLGGDVQTVFAAAKAGDWTRGEDGTVAIAGQTLQPEEFDLQLEAVDPTTTAGLRSNDIVVVLDTEVTPELEAEGLARDLIRHVQQARKDADLQVTDRITVQVHWSPPQIEEIRRHEPAVTSAVLAERIEWLDGDDVPRVSIAAV